jgi:hypothetical protein
MNTRKHTIRVARVAGGVELSLCEAAVFWDVGSGRLRICWTTEAARLLGEALLRNAGAPEPPEPPKLSQLDAIEH